MPQVSIHERGPSKTGLLAQGLGQAVGQVAGAYGGQQIRKGQLSQAFQEAKTAQEGGGNYLDIMGKLAPYMMSVPGGSELLSNIAPIISANAESEAITRSIDKMRDQTNSIEEQKVGAGAGPGEKEKPKMENVPGTTMKVREPGQEISKEKKIKAPSSRETLHPQKTIEPNLQKPMNPTELNTFALDLVRNSGGKIPFEKAYQIANQQNDAISNLNQKILQEQQMQKVAIEEMGKTYVTRAENTGLISSNNPEQKTMVEKLAYEARNAGTPAEQWEYIRDNTRRFNTATSSIRTAGDLSGPLGNLWKKGISQDYKNIEEIQKSIQQPMEFYKEHGMIPELREEVSTSLGLGPEMTEETIFPFSPEQKKEIENFPKSPKELSMFQKLRIKVGEIGKLEQQFPGAEFKLDDEQRNQLKDQIESFLTKEGNENVNIISFRGRLNQEKKYAWQDIAQSFTELQNEGRWSPDPIQEQQLNVIMHAPLPGLVQQFEYLYKGKK